MNITEMYELAKKFYEENETDYAYIGLRFENKGREIGEVIVDRSRHNAEREDDREFPAYGTEEYEEMEELDGVSAWDLSALSERNYPGFGRAREADPNKDCTWYFDADHCYVIAGNVKRTHDDADDGEVVIRNAVVITQIF